MSESARDSGGEASEEALVSLDVDEDDAFDAVHLVTEASGTKLVAGRVDAKPGRYKLVREETEK